MHATGQTIFEFDVDTKNFKQPGSQNTLKCAYDFYIKSLWSRLVYDQFPFERTFFEVLRE